jgi:hypothetical protein
VVHENINELLYGKNYKSRTTASSPVGIPKRLIISDTALFDDHIVSDATTNHHVKSRVTELPISATTFSCSDKEDDQHYEHLDCKKYWHCLYVGSIFQTALERKCPPGTMFHPISSTCELSTIVTDLELFIHRSKTGGN